MQKKKLIVMCSLLVAIVLLGIGTIAYFRRTVNGDITGQTGNLVLIVNEADAVANESFEVILQRSEEENFIMPDDKGVFNLNIDSTGSSDDVEVTITISRTNLPENLRFYLDSNYNQELTTKTYIIEKSDDMTKTVPVYWFWDGSISDEADSEFINKTISANISVTATIFKPFVETLISKATLDTNVNFLVGTKYIILDEKCEEYSEQCDNTGNYCEEFEQQCYAENGKGLMLRDGTQNDKYPIAYFRGDVNDNNVIYAGYCWLIVRTTETGGIKLIYNGYVNDDGSCSNYSNVTVEGVNSAEATEEPGKYDNYYMGAYINQQTYAFTTKNYSPVSPVYVGYMYNDDNLYFNCTEYDYEYGVCINGQLDIDSYKLHLEDNTIYEGIVYESLSTNYLKAKLELMDIDTNIGRHNQNKYDSNIKEVIDRWYRSNILGKPQESLLEDTVWCNDRSVTSAKFSLENYTTNNNQFVFGAMTRLGTEIFLNNTDIMSSPIIPSLVCSRDIDKFTVEKTNGNGDLTYPIGMLTADEIVMAGNAVLQYIPAITYLSIPTHRYWSLSPFYFDYGNAYEFRVDRRELRYAPVSKSDAGVRPSVSLAVTAKLQGGDGTFKTPYNFDVVQPN